MPLGVLSLGLGVDLTRDRDNTVDEVEHDAAGRAGRRYGEALASSR